MRTSSSGTITHKIRGKVKYTIVMQVVRIFLDWAAVGDVQSKSLYQYLD